MLTSGDDSLQSNDVGMVKLAHNAGLTQKFSSLLLWISGFQTLDGHLDLPLTGQPQTATADLPKLTWESNKSLSTNLVYIYIYAVSKRFYPKRITVHSGNTFFYQYVCSLGI